MAGILKLYTLKILVIVLKNINKNNIFFKKQYPAQD